MSASGSPSAASPATPVPGASSADVRARLPISSIGTTTVLAPLVLGAVVVLAWEAAVRGLDIAPYIVPAPSAIAEQFTASLDSVRSGAFVTGRNAALGLLGGAVVGIVVATLAGLLRVVDEMLAPVVAALSVVPIVALAPVLYTMFGYATETARIIVAGIAVAVPVFLNTLRGLHQVAPVHRDLMRACAATPLQVARTVTLPTATPYVFTGLRVGSSLAVISALVAEYFGGPVGGLGKSITTAASGSQYALAWAYVLGAIALGLLFYVVTLLAELALSRHRGA